MVTLTKRVIPGPDWHCALREFLQYLPAKYKWRRKKSYYLRAGPWHWAKWQIRPWLLHYVHKKFRWGPEVATFRTKNLISPWLYLSIGWKNWIKGERRAPWLSILFIVNYYSTRVLSYAKMLKETENEKTRLFCQICVIGGISIEEAWAPWAIPLTTLMILR